MQYLKNMVLAALAACMAAAANAAPSDPALVSTYTPARQPHVMTSGSVSARVVDSRGMAIADADVTISGATELSTVTADDGSFAFSGLSDGKYRLQINKLLLTPYDAELTIAGSPMQLGDIVLTSFLGKPAALHCDATEAGILVSWMAPVGKTTLIYDNNVCGGAHTLAGETLTRAYFGVMLDEAVVVESVRWLVSGLTNGKVGIAIFPIDSNGDISRTPSYEIDDVPSQTYNWSDDNPNWQSFVLPEPVEAPYGCIVSLFNGPGCMSICSDRAGGWSHSYTAYNNLETGWKQETRANNFMIHTGCTLLSRDVAPGGPNVAAVRVASVQSAGLPEHPVLDGISYSVWRMQDDDASPENGTMLGTGLNTLYCFDCGLQKLPQGVYTYAVQASADDGRKSEIATSAPYRHKMTTDAAVYVFTNTAIDFGDGTKVTLTAADGSEYSTTVTDNTASFKALPKGVYALKATREGFKPYQANDIDFSVNNHYDLTIDLELNAMAPFGLVAEQSPESQAVTLRWNQPEGIFEDFESMPDFEINPTGALGWSYADLDQSSTYGLNPCAGSPYPGMWSPMAFQCFNPSATQPDLTSYVQPVSGNKVLISAGAESCRSDDWLFSPEFDSGQELSFRFHAVAGFYGMMGREEFQVGYTTGDATPDAVIWLTATPMSVGGAWTEFDFTLPADARRAVIRCVSRDRLIFVLDDIFIGREEADIFAMTTFRIRLDNELIGTTARRSWNLGTLDEGKHLATVQTIYPMADGNNSNSRATQLLFEVEKRENHAGVESVAAGELYTYDAFTHRLSAGESVVTLEVFDLQGRMIGSGHEVSLTGKSAGIYVVRVATATGEIITGKITVI